MNSKNDIDLVIITAENPCNELLRKGHRGKTNKPLCLFTDNCYPEMRSKSTEPML